MQNEKSPLVKKTESYGSELESPYDDLAYDQSAASSNLGSLSMKQMNLEMVDVSFTVQENRKSLKETLCGGGNDIPLEKVILHNVNCSIPAGTLTAIMGPSGAGKSTLMDVLANRKKSGWRDGDVLVNGKPQGPGFRRTIAYCTQDDILVEDLTVGENLYYAAKLLLPSSLGEQAIHDRVDIVISALRLTKVRNSIVGGLWTRGISGGEKRRLSIGLELLTSPTLLLGDELTSGLDSFSAFSLMRVLSRLAHDGDTVVLNIHQPSSTLFGMFDNLILLAEGHIIYEGPVKMVGHYFEELGFVCPPGWAMADFLLELVSRVGIDAAALEMAGGRESKSERDDILRDIFGENLKKHTSTSLAEHFLAQRTGSERTEEKLAPKGRPLSGANQMAEFPPHEEQTGSSFPNNWFYQTYVLVQRQLARWRRNPMSVAQIFIMYLISALIIGLLYSNVQEENLLQQYTLSAAFTLDMFGVLAFMNIGNYLKERSQFNRESSAGYFHTSAYYMSGLITSTLVFVLVVIMMCAMLFYMVDYPTDTPEAFMKYTLICYLNLAIFQGMVEWLSASFTTLDSALLVTGNFLVVSMTLSGITVNYPNIPIYLKPLYWGNHMTYLVSAMLVVVFEDYTCEIEGVGEVDCGIEYLRLIGLQIEDVWTNIAISCVFLVFYRFMTYLSLRFLHKES